MSEDISIRDRLARGPAVWALAASMTLIYSTIYYNYSGLILFWVDDPGWSKVLLAAGPMLAQLIAALMAPFCGRQVDQGRGPEMLLFGPVLGAAALAALAFVTEAWHWIAAWAVIGVAQALCFYEVGFAFLIRRLGPSARAAIIRVTLVAGFASTVAFPTYAALGNGPGWRMATLWAAVLTVLLVVPLNLYATRRIRRDAPPPQSGSSGGTEEAPPAQSSRRAMILLILVSASCSMNHWMIVTYIVPILVAKGFSTAMAVTMGACLGPAQVLSRLGLMWGGHRVSNHRGVMVLLSLMLLASGALVAASAGLVFAVIYVACQGAAFGAMTILRPGLIADVMGPENYGSNAGKILMPTLFAGAMAPMIGAIMLENMGFEALAVLSLMLLTTALLALRSLKLEARTG
ncbi:MFS transporter [Falsigemmobacter faecalis]|uniref:MFS transporter n=1 Tax=Falsigemmobacter faecalis TaxID=2488730 RepID=A0A3P3DS87_9RHOB|nr:MFS transporter [Falsigemmobacter faecalis]RRH76556.1 MFS transporter [Falsigemmobacter faecalis]